MLFRKLVNSSLLSAPFRCSPLFASHHMPSPTNTDSEVFEFTPENQIEVQKILANFPSNYKRSGCIPLLMLAQKQNNNFLSLSAMRKVAKIMDVPEINVFETASFYTMFNRVPVGKFHLQLCGTTPCQLCGSREIKKALENHLGIHDSETTSDGLFTIQEVECLGACANAPMLQVNGEWVYEDLTVDSAIKLVEDFKNGKSPIKGPQNGRNECEGIQGRTTLKEIKNIEQITFDRDFKKEKEDYLAQKEKERLEAEQKKAAAMKK